MTFQLTIAALRTFAPRANAVLLAPLLDVAMSGAEISTPRRGRHFLAHTFVESGGFALSSHGIFEENLNYSAERLMQVWPHRFPTLASVGPYAHNPEALANKVYGGRGGNVNPGDGWRYRGGGLIGLTFHDGYKAASAYCGQDLVANPDLARQPASACTIAAQWWEHHGLNQVVDADPGEVALGVLADRTARNEFDDVVQATQIINGGQTGAELRKAALQRAAAIWGD